MYRCFLDERGNRQLFVQLLVNVLLGEYILHVGHSIPNQHEIDMTSSDFFVICYT